MFLLLEEFRDGFVCDYSEMSGLDLGLVVRTLNMELRAKLVAQLAKVFHTKVEEQIKKEVQKLLIAGFFKLIQHLR